MIEKYLSVEIENLGDQIKPAELQDAILDILIGKTNISSLDKFKM